MTSVPAMPTLLRDLSAGLVVFLVALPLCLGVALASNAPLFAGLVAGIIGGILVGLLSGSQTSVSGPAAGLTAIVAAQIAELGSFQTLQLALVIAGVMQLGLGIARVGFLAAFFPSSVIKGLAIVVSCIDSRTPAELIFDLGVGDILASASPETSLVGRFWGVSNTDVLWRVLSWL